MNKIVVLTSIVGLWMLNSCCSDCCSNKSNEAKKIELIKTKSTVIYSGISDSSNIEWGATHLGGTSPRYGKIKLSKAEFLVNKGVLTNATILVDMQTLTVESFPKGNPQIVQLTHHLKSEDFFKVETFPTSKFELASLEKTKGDNNYIVIGNLTILDITKSITFKANISMSEEKLVINSDKFTVDRTNWGLVYHVEGSKGVPVDYLISNDVDFTINIEVAR